MYCNKNSNIIFHSKQFTSMSHIVQEENQFSISFLCGEKHISLFHISRCDWMSVIVPLRIRGGSLIGPCHRSRSPGATGPGPAHWSSRCSRWAAGRGTSRSGCCASRLSGPAGETFVKTQKQKAKLGHRYATPSYSVIIIQLPSVTGCVWHSGWWIDIHIDHRSGLFNMQWLLRYLTWWADLSGWQTHSVPHFQLWSRNTIILTLTFFISKAASELSSRERGPFVGRIRYSGDVCVCMFYEISHAHTCQPWALRKQHHPFQTTARGVLVDRRCC